MKKWKKRVCVLPGMVVCLFLINNFHGGYFHYDKNIHMVQAEDYWPVGPEIEGEAAVVMDASTGTVLYEKNPHEQLYPASITKILTALLAVEQCSLEEEVTFSYDSAHKIEGTHISRDVGEIMTMEQCLYAVLLGSANDCAYAVAEHVGNSYDNFIKMMNDRAAELGCENTNFNNPHGLPDEGHYTSAYDMALISREALKNDIFRKISETERYTIPKTNKHPDEETYLVNHHKMLTAYKGDSSKLYEYCIGGKTGFTQAAGATLVTFAEKNGMTLVCVVLKEEGTNHYSDTRSLFDYCFENFKLWNIAENELEYIIEGTADPEIFGDSNSFVDMDDNDQIVLPKSIPFGEAVSQVNMEHASKKVLATLDYIYAGKVVGSTNIRVKDTKVSQFQFKVKEVEVPEGKENKVINIKMQYILIGVGILIAAVLLGIGIFFLSKNFYLIRYKIRSRSERNQQYKVIKTGKQSRWGKRGKWR